MATVSPLISAYPSRNNAIIARDHFYGVTLRSLAYLKGVYENSVESQSFNIEKLIYARHGVAALDPYIFYIHDAILSSMRRQDIETTRSLFSALRAYCERLGVQQADRSFPIVRNLGETPWEDFIVAVTHQSVKDDLGREPELKPVEFCQATKENDNVVSALELIRETFPEMGDEIEAFLNCIRIFTGHLTMGITDVRMFGCMFIRHPRVGVSPPLYYSEHICHEVSHMYLNAAMSIDPIVLNSRDDRYKSPIRPDPRPMIGIFHATFVTSRIVQFFTRLCLNAADGERLTYLEQQLTELRDGIQEITRYGRLTDAGYQLLTEFGEIYDFAARQEFWTGYDFTSQREHRFGGGFMFQKERPVLGSIHQN